VIARRFPAILVAAALLGASGCCRILDVQGDAPDPEPTPTTKAEELGTASFPAGAKASAVIHTWSAKQLKPSVYRVGYALTASESAAVDGSLHDYATRVGYADEGDGKFRWVPPTGCSGDMHCVFADLVARDAPDLAPLVDRFRARKATAGLSTMELAALVVTFVQNIPYEIPKEEPFGVLPPALVVARRKGDCDSKSLLAHVILHSLGYDTMLLSSSAHHHSMLGIALPAPGTKITYSGRDYAFTEMTARGSPIGHINADLLRPNDWKPVPFRYPDAATPPVKTTPAAPTPKKAPAR
jgi:hypothetical protein